MSVFVIRRSSRGYVPCFRQQPAIIAAEERRAGRAATIPRPCFRISNVARRVHATECRPRETIFCNEAPLKLSRYSTDTSVIPGPAGYERNGRSLLSRSPDIPKLRGRIFGFLLRVIIASRYAAGIRRVVRIMRPLAQFSWTRRRPHCFGNRYLVAFVCSDR